MAEFHSLDLNQDEDGWDYASCACGWISPPCPGADIAAEFYADHLPVSLPTKDSVDGR